MPELRNTAFWATRPVRRITAGQRKVADIVICGAQKSGTTYLADLMGSQAGFYCPPIKEIFFFNAHWEKGTAWYSSHFQLRSSDALQVDATPSYMIHGAVPERIRSVNPDAKLIFMLRDPVSRAYSHFQHNLRAGLEDLDFAAALAAEDGRIAEDVAAMERDPDLPGVSFALYSYRTRGVYARFLEGFYDTFPRDQVLVLDSARVFSHDPDEFRMVEDFVGRGIALDPGAKTNAGNYAKDPDAATQELRRFYELHDPALVELTGRRFSWMEQSRP